MKDGMQLEQDQVVSVWVGTFGSEEEFAEYLAEDPESLNDDQAALNDFAEEFGFDWYDNDLQDAHFPKPEPQPLEELLDYISYGGSFIPEVLRTAEASGIKEANCFICLYDFEYPTKMLPLKSKMEFLGAFDYKRQ
jgi:hypothetical protein